MENLLGHLERLASILDGKKGKSGTLIPSTGLLTIEAMLKATIRPFAYSIIIRQYTEQYCCPFAV
jgi:hypothetical protein